VRERTYGGLGYKSYRFLQSDTPWRYLGPVLKSDVSTAAASSALGTWNADQVYLEGSKVLYNGLVYEARWWTQADVPSSDPQRLGNVPWKALEEATTAQLAAASDSLAGSTS
jgi:chitinase